MSFIVEQVASDGSIVMDYDTTISPGQLYNRIHTYFPQIRRADNSIICGTYQGQNYAIRVKNISYLGNPHPLYKKRIQIPGDLQTFYAQALAMGCKPMLLGVYTYGSTELFCEFNIEDFIGKKANNSSAHVYCSDMVDALIHDYFQKIDYFGNRITVFTPQAVSVFLEEFFADSAVFEPARTARADFPDVSSTAMPAELIHSISRFFQEENRIWNGIDCYQKMIAADYRNKFQPEWAGFFLEYEFENYINNNHLTHLVRYAQDKSKDGIDLDLFFPTIHCYGDLKAHSEESRGVQGNDWGTVFSILDGNTYGNHIFYIICEHATVKDKDRDFSVTHYWNQVQHKANLMSYSGRMKHSVELKHFYILDINNSNKAYLTKFRQGINSNGKPRPPKIMIEHDNFDKFVIAEMKL